MDVRRYFIQYGKHYKYAIVREHGARGYGVYAVSLPASPDCSGDFDDEVGEYNLMPGSDLFGTFEDAGEAEEFAAQVTGWIKQAHAAA